MKNRGSIHPQLDPSTPDAPALGICGGSIHARPDPSTPAAPALRMGFTLIELILVMLIIAITAAIVVPSFNTFQIGKNTDNATATLITLANYARTQAINEGRIYRMNFDPTNAEVWLTVEEGGVYVAPPGDFGKQFPLPTGIKMDVNVTPQPSTSLLLPTNVTQTAVQPVPPFGQTLAPTNELMQSPHDVGIYTEFQPSGRSDPILIHLSDRLGKQVDLGAASATESLHVLSEKEMQQ